MNVRIEIRPELDEEECVLRTLVVKFFEASLLLWEFVVNLPHVHGLKRNEKTINKNQHYRNTSQFINNKCLFVIIYNIVHSLPATGRNSRRALRCVRKDVFDTAKIIKENVCYYTKSINSRRRAFPRALQIILAGGVSTAHGALTISGSRWCSMNAENSTKRSLCVAIALPSHGGTLGGWISDDTAVDGGFSPVDPANDPWANGLTLRGRYTMLTSDIN